MCSTLHFASFLAVLLCEISARAPGDGDAFCSNPDMLVTYSSNIKVLMDSFSYFNLIPPHQAKWQLVDLDSNNAAGGSTLWTQNSNSVCRQTLFVCGFERGVQNNWVITQFISRTVNSIRLPQVQLQLELQFFCADVSCKGTIKVYVYETSRENSASGRNTNNYRLLTKVSSDHERRHKQNLMIDFQSQASGFYLAMVDEGTCLLVHRVLVFYNVCPEENAGLVMLPETPAPINDPLEVTAECVAGASPDTIRLNCNQGGVWDTSTVSGSGCRCGPGFGTSLDGQSCSSTRCISGQYYSLNMECVNCPKNSGLSECLCKEGYYRAPGEEGLPCTQPPSEPRNLVINVIGNTASLTWDEPLSLGGRTDTFYSIKYRKAGSDTVENVGTTTNTSTVITDLQYGAQYVVFVSAVNGVSTLAGTSDNIADGIARIFGDEATLMPLTEEDDDLTDLFGDLFGDDSQAAITMSVLLILVSNSAAAIIVLL